MLHTASSRSESQVVVVDSSIKSSATGDDAWNAADKSTMPLHKPSNEGENI
jgi:hypothetical protein